MDRPIITLLVLILASLAEALHARSDPATAGEAVWGMINGSSTLQWTPCYLTFQCAKLTVPLNYSDPSGPPATIAIIRQQANVTDPALYRGPILFNPGGPGGSGVDLILTGAASAATLLGPEFDLVSFDPRGVSRTEPAVSWFESDIEAALWNADAGNAAMTTYADFTHLWPRGEILGRIAEERNYAAIAHVRTENVATDMLKITEAFGYEKLQYWGFSYGTLLGTTFASLYPDKVGRVVLDGVLDAEDYYATNLVDGLRDTDKAMQIFFDQCAASSPQQCAFYSPTSSEIKSRLDKLYSAVKNEPIAVQTTAGYGYDYVDYSTLRSAVSLTLYSPYTLSATLAQALKDLEQGNGTGVVNIARSVTKLECTCGQPPTTVVPSDEAAIAILCGDGQVQKENSPSAFYQKYLMMEQNWSSFADLFVVLSARCSGWRFRAPERFLGPFGGITSYPMLFIGNMADPVTPLWSAQHMAASFPNSTVLTQNSSGHTSISAPSLCTLQYVRDYFRNGTLPADGTVCDVTAPFFMPSNPGNTTTSRGFAAVSREDEERLNALRSLSRDSNIARPLRGLFL